VQVVTKFLQKLLHAIECDNLVQPNMKIVPFIHSYIVPKLYFCLWDTKKDILFDHAIKVNGVP